MSKGTRVGGYCSSSNLEGRFQSGTPTACKEACRRRNHARGKDGMPVTRIYQYQVPEVQNEYVYTDCLIKIPVSYGGWYSGVSTSHLLLLVCLKCCATVPEYR